MRNVAGDHGGERRRAALVGDRDDLGAGHVVQQLAGEMRRGAVAGHAIGHASPAWLSPLRQADSCRFFAGAVLGHHDRERRIGDFADRGKILEGVVGQLRIEELVERMARSRPGSACSHRAADCVRACEAMMPPAPGRLSITGCWPQVFDSDCAERARQHVDRAARRIGHQDRHRLARKRLGVQRRAGESSSAAAVAMASFMGASKETGKDTGMGGRPSCNIAQQSRVVAT